MRLTQMDHSRWHGPSEFSARRFRTRVDILVCSWPKDLPCFEVVEVSSRSRSEIKVSKLISMQHVVGVFFDKIPLVPQMFNKAKFKTNLQLPPSHADFPVSYACAPPSDAGIHAKVHDTVESHLAWNLGRCCPPHTRIIPCLPRILPLGHSPISHTTPRTRLRYRHPWSTQRRLLYARV